MYIEFYSSVILCEVLRSYMDLRCTNAILIDWLTDSLIDWMIEVSTMSLCFAVHSGTLGAYSFMKLKKNFKGKKMSEVMTFKEYFLMIFHRLIRSGLPAYFPGVVSIVIAVGGNNCKRPTSEGKWVKLKPYKVDKHPRQGPCLKLFTRVLILTPTLTSPPNSKSNRVKWINTHATDHAWNYSRGY